jgi:hypothetical protein
MRLEPYKRLVPTIIHYLNNAVEYEWVVECFC